jgi:hypothetical protein
MMLAHLAQSFGRTSPQGLTTLGDATPAAEPNTPTGGCSVTDWYADAPPLEPGQKPEDQKMKYGTTLALITGGLVAAGAVIGAVAMPASRGKAAAIGAGVGLLGSAGVGTYQYMTWRNEGGTSHRKGACEQAAGQPAAAVKY